jgi:hypothetical protein
MKPLVYHCEANVELTATAKHYQCQSSNLARDFLAAVRLAQLGVQQNPERFPFLSHPVRSRRINRFPYRLVYEELSDCVHVVALMHDSRDPNYWKNRLS